MENGQMNMVDQCEQMDEEKDTPAFGKRVTVKKDLILTPNQKKSMAMIRKFFKYKIARELCLSGYAGTGKTTLVGELVRVYQVLFPKKKIAVCAPTNKAVKVVSDKSGQKGMTIHRMLGVRMEPDQNGNYKQAFGGREHTHEYDLIVVDEASMLDEKLLAIIREYQSRYRFKIIYAGDPAQLPPVKSPSSPVFGIPGGTLTQVVRQQKHSPILSLATILRDNLCAEAGGIAQVFSWEGSEELTYENDEGAFVRAAVSEFRGADDDDRCRVLSYTNQKVNDLNKAIRKGLYGEEVNEYVKGERVITLEPIGPYEGRKVVEVSTSQDMRVLSAEKTIEGKYSIWLLEAEYFDLAEGGLKRRLVKTLAEESRSHYASDLEILLQKARADHRFWNDFYMLKEEYDKIGYGYALTIHKSQGSTFQTTYLHEPDIFKCPDGTEMQNKLRYTAVTRPSKRLVVFTV